MKMTGNGQQYTTTDENFEENAEFNSAYALGPML